MAEGGNILTFQRRHEVGTASPPPPRSGVSVELITAIVKAWSELEPDVRLAFFYLSEGISQQVERLPPGDARSAVKFMERFSAEEADRLRRRYI